MYTLLPKSTPNLGYIEEWDIIEYDFVNNWLQYRADRRGNEFSYCYLTDINFQGLPALGYSAIIDFQWGNNLCFSNKIHEGRLSQINSLGSIYYNTLGGNSAIYYNILEAESNISYNSLDAKTSIYSNVLSSGAGIFLNTLNLGATINYNSLDTNAAIGGNQVAYGAATIYANSLGSSSAISGNIVNGPISSNTLNANALIWGNTINNVSSLQLKTLAASVQFFANVVGVAINGAETYSSNIVNKRAENGFSNFEVNLTDADVSGGTLTIPAANSYCGIINLSSLSLAETISQITPVPPRFPYTIFPASGLTLTLTGTAFASAGAGDIVLPTSSISLNGTQGAWIKLQTDPTNTFSLQIDTLTYI